VRPDICSTVGRSCRVGAPLPTVVRRLPRTVHRPGPPVGHVALTDRPVSTTLPLHRIAMRGQAGGDLSDATGDRSSQRPAQGACVGRRGHGASPLCVERLATPRGTPCRPKPRPDVRIREPRVICVQSGRLHGDGDPETLDRRTDESSIFHHPSLTSAGHNTAGRRLDDLPSRSRAPALLLLDLRTGREARTGTGTRKGRVMTPSPAGTNANNVRDGRRMASSLRCEAHDQSHGWITEQVRPHVAGRSPDRDVPRGPDCESRTRRRTA